MKKWYKLDNVGKFYASIANAKIPKVFRYSVNLFENIDETILQFALNKTIEIYPNFNVNLKKGMFWYYLDETHKKNRVTKENLPICFKIYNNSDDFLYRVSYYKRKINFEVSHILSDGRGSVEFFKLLITNYLSIKYDLRLDSNKDNKSQLEKSEDSFDKYYKKMKLSKNKKTETYIYKGKKYSNQTRYMEAYMNVSDVLDLAHRYNTTLTAFLVSVLIYAHKDELKLSELNKSIKIDLPVDLRPYFKSYSSMNFFGVTTISYKFRTKDDTLEDIVREVNCQFKEQINVKKISERVNLMVSFEKNWFCRFVPINIKNIFLNLADKVASQQSTTCLSNIGIIKFDKELEDKIDSISVLTSTYSFQFTTCTFKDKLCIGISNNYINNDIIKNLCCYLSEHGIQIKINVSEVR